MKRTLCVVLAFFVFISGCTGYRPEGVKIRRVTLYPNYVTQDDVSVAIHALTKEGAHAAFDTPIVEKKIQPLVVAIENKSKTVYSFEKKNLCADYIPADKAAKKGKRKTAARTAAYGVWAIVLWPLLIPAAIAGIQSARANSKMKSFFRKQEIKDGEIEPGETLSGFIYTPPVTKDQPMMLRLTEVDGDKTLDIPVTVSGYPKE